MNFIQDIFTGQYAILVWFLMAIIVLYIPYLIIYLHRRKKKGTDYLKIHPDAVKVFIKRTKTNDLLTIIDIDREKPVMFSDGIKYGFYLTPGDHVLKLKYQWTKSSALGKLVGKGLGGYKTFDFPVKNLEVFPKRGQTYQLYYHHASEKFVFERRTK